MQLKFEMSLRDKQRFFDREAVRQSLEPAFASYLLQSGALVRTIAQRSMRRGGKKKKASEPGKPPNHHMPGSNEGLRRIIYVLGKDKISVDIGPVKYDGTKNPTVPMIHEFGATVMVPRRAVRPTASTRWMFEPKNKEKYKGLHRRIERLARIPESQHFSVILHDARGVPRQVYDRSDFRVQDLNVAVRYRKRPFMQPAVDNPKTQDQLKQIWAKTIQKTIKQGIRWSKSSGR